MINKAIKHLCDKIDDKVQQLQDALGGSSAKDFSEYKAMCGEIKGLLTARMYLTDLETKLEELDE